MLEDVLKVLLSVSNVLDPPKSPSKRGTLIPVPLFLSYGVHTSFSRASFQP